MGRVFKHERLKIDIEDLSKQLEEMEKRYKATLDNLVANDTKANRRAEKMLFQRITEARKELKALEHELSTMTGKTL